MSSIKLYNDLNIQFIGIDTVKTLLNKKDPECVNVLENWLINTESILKENNINESRLIAKYKGQLVIEKLRKDRKIPKRKREFSAVSNILIPLKETILNIIEPMDNKIRESEILVNRMLSFKKFHWNEGLNYRDYILAVWRTLLNEQNTQMDANMVLKLIGEEDALNLIANKLKPAKKPLD